MNTLSEPGGVSSELIPSKRKMKDYIVGLVLLLVVVLLWTASSFLTQVRTQETPPGLGSDTDYFLQDMYDDGYQKPFL